MAEPSGWTLDLTGDGAPVATDIYDAAPLPYCGKPGFCSEHLHVMADHTPVGPVVISLPREAVEGPDYSDMQLAPIYTAAVFHARGRSTVRLPTFAGRKRPSLKVVVPAILDAVMALPDQGGVRWRDVNPSSFTVVDDQRECGNLAALERNFLLPDQCVCRVAVDGVEGAKQLAHRIFGPIGMQRRASGRAPLATVTPRRTDLEKLRQLQLELLQTERNYVEILSFLQEKILPELEASAKSSAPLISTAEITLIFSGLEHILSFNRAFLSDLETAMLAGDGGVGASGLPTVPLTSGARHVPMSKRLHLEEVLLKHIKGFSAYLGYVSYYAKARQTLVQCQEQSPRFDDYVKQCQERKGAHRLDLAGLLIAPIQRIPRYELLLGNMLEYATDEYPRIGDLKEAHRQIHEVGQDINEARRRADAHWAIFNIQQNVSQCPPTLVSASRTYLGYFHCQEARPNTGRRMANYWTLFLCDDLLIVAKRALKSSFLRRREDRRRWAYSFFRLVPLDDLRIVRYPGADNDEVVTLEWPQAAARGPDAATAAAPAGKITGPDEVAYETLTVTSMERDEAAQAAVDPCAVLATMALQNGAVPTADTMATFADKISNAISECCERTQHVQAPKHSMKFTAPPPRAPLAVEMLYLVRPIQGWRSQASKGQQFEPASLLIITDDTTSTQAALASMPESLLESSYVVGHLQATATGGFRTTFLGRPTAAGIAQLPPVGPDCRGTFDAHAAAEAATMLSQKLINVQAAYLRDVLRRSTFADTSFETLLSEFVAAQLALVDSAYTLPLRQTPSARPMRRMSSLRRRNSRSDAVTPVLVRQASSSSMASPSWSATFSGNTIRRVASVRGHAGAVTESQLDRRRAMPASASRLRRGPLLAVVTTPEGAPQEEAALDSAVSDLISPLSGEATVPHTPGRMQLAAAAADAQLTPAQTVVLDNLTQLTKAIERHVLTRSDLYADPPSRKSEQVKYYDAVFALLPNIEDPIAPSKVAQAPLPVLCGAVWRLLQFLPAPLIPRTLQPEIVQACKWAYKKESAGMLQATLNRFPSFEYLMLRTLMLHLRRCIDMPGNKCSYALLDQQLRPLIVRDRALRRDGDIQSVVDETDDTPPIVARLLEHATELFTNALPPSAAATPSRTPAPPTAGVRRPSADSPSPPPDKAAVLLPKPAPNAGSPAAAGTTSKRRKTDKENDDDAAPLPLEAEDVIVTSARLQAARQSVAQCEQAALAAQRLRLDWAHRAPNS